MNTMRLISILLTLVNTIILIAYIVNTSPFPDFVLAIILLLFDIEFAFLTGCIVTQYIELKS